MARQLSLFSITTGDVIGSNSTVSLFGYYNRITGNDARRQHGFILYFILYYYSTHGIFEQKHSTKRMKRQIEAWIILLDTSVTCLLPPMALIQTRRLSSAVLFEPPIPWPSAPTSSPTSEAPSVYETELYGNYNFFERK